MAWRRGARARLILASLAALGLGACSPPAKPLAPQPVKNIDASRFFTGRWYEIARTPTKPANCVAGTIDYSTNADGLLLYRYACRMGTPEGEEKLFEGPASLLTPANNKITVHTIIYGFIPTKRTYWILDHGDDYGWFIVTDPAFDMAALFTRDVHPSAVEIAALTARVAAFGYPASRLQYPALFPAGRH